MPFFAALAAAAAVASASAPIAAAPQSVAPAQDHDAIGEVLDALTGALSNAVQAVELQVKATLYHSGVKGLRPLDSMGCPLQAMRTLAVDPKITPRGSIVFIKETVGMPLPGGGVHDGVWYASDTGGAIKGARIDLYTGANAASMGPLRWLNLHTLTLSKIGAFVGCPPARRGVEKLASN